MAEVYFGLKQFLIRYYVFAKVFQAPCYANDPLQRPVPPPLVINATTDKPCHFHAHTSCSHAMKNTLWREEDTDNMPTDKTEQVTFSMKQSLSFQMWSFKEFK